MPKKSKESEYESYSNDPEDIKDVLKNKEIKNKEIKNKTIKKSTNMKETKDTKETKELKPDRRNQRREEKDSSDISDIDENDEISDAFKYDEKKSKVKGKKEISDEENIGGTEPDYDNMDEDEKKEYIQTVVLERVIKYIKLDDVIKEKQKAHKEEMKTIKDSKEQLESFLIGYLDKIDEQYVQLGNKATLIKTEVKTKAAPKMEDISVCLVEGFRKHEIYDDDAEIKRVVKDFIETIESKREVKTRKYLKRTTGDPGEIVQKGKKGDNKEIKAEHDDKPKMKKQK